MSIYRDDRQYSDDPDEYLEWKSELIRESRFDDYDPEYDGYENYDDDLVVDIDD